MRFPVWRRKGGAFDRDDPTPAHALQRGASAPRGGLDAAGGPEALQERWSAPHHQTSSRELIPRPPRQCCFQHLFLNQPPTSTRTACHCSRFNSHFCPAGLSACHGATGPVKLGGCLFRLTCNTVYYFVSVFCRCLLSLSLSRNFPNAPPPNQTAIQPGIQDQRQDVVTSAPPPKQHQHHQCALLVHQASKHYSLRCVYQSTISQLDTLSLMTSLCWSIFHSAYDDRAAMAALRCSGPTEPCFASACDLQMHVARLRKSLSGVPNQYLSSARVNWTRSHRRHEK